jgi:TonB family protein
VRGERRLVNLSDALGDADETGANPRAERSGAGLEIGLLENSAYTLMPEFLWGTPEIAYPEWARRRGSEGQVLLVIEIRENGEVGMARAAETPLDPELSDFVTKEASTWRFKPMYKDGRALSGTVSVRVRCVLDGGSPAVAQAPGARRPARLEPGPDGAFAGTGRFRLSPPRRPRPPGSRKPPARAFLGGAEKGLVKPGASC